MKRKITESVVFRWIMSLGFIISLIFIASIANAEESDGAIMPTACLTDIDELRANCTGLILKDVSSDNCRTVECSNNLGSVKTVSCMKTDDTGTFLEMRRQSKVFAQPQICLGNDCLRSGEEYRKGSSFPICTQVPSQDPGKMKEKSVTVSIAPWYPQGNDYIFYCRANWFKATSYDWFFGDGQKLLNMRENNVYHSFEDGAYTVTCIARNKQIVKEGNLTVVV